MLTPFLLDSTSKSLCLTKFGTTCPSTYLRLLELDHVTLDQSITCSVAIHPWPFDNRIEIRILDPEISVSRVSDYLQILARRNCNHSSLTLAMRGICFHWRRFWIYPASRGPSIFLDKSGRAFLFPTYLGISGILQSASQYFEVCSLETFG